jgi:hypothetical protein
MGVLSPQPLKSTLKMMILLKTPEILAVVSSLSNTITEFSNQSSKFF